MSGASTKYGILAGVDGSAESRAAATWTAGEAALRHEPVTLVHVIPPAMASWPIAAEQATIAKSQEDNAREVLVQARNDLAAVLDQAQPLQVRTQVLYANIVHALVDASKDARMNPPGRKVQ